METTLKDLCASFPKVSIQHSPLDNVAAEIFNPHNNQRYIQSTSGPSERYGIRIDNLLLRHHNEYIQNFNDYGPNEQYLINKVFYSPSNLLYIIGGIGVGKTRFIHFLLNEILPNAISNEGGVKNFGPCSIYYDFLDEGNTLPPYEDSNGIKIAFTESLCDRIEAELYSHDFFDLDYEVGTIWDEILENYKNDYNKHTALSFIIKELRLNEAEKKDLIDNYSQTIKKRKAIRQKIRGNQGRSISYLALLLEYTRKKYFNSNPAGLLLVIDNVDRETSLVQQQVKLIIKPFARVSGGRTIINARQTTYYQQFDDDGSSDPIDVVPYCGPKPVEILKARIDDFIDNHQRFNSYYNPEYLPYLVEGIKNIRENYLNNDALLNLFTNLCGRSIRRCLLLAQNLINNSVFDPSRIVGDVNDSSKEKSNIRIGDILRAIIVGTEDIFRTSPINIIDNLFQVSSFSGSCYLLKLRILKLIFCSKNFGVTITSLIGKITGFGYSISMICDAINELKSEQKRLIWSDSVRMNFKNEEDLVSHGPTRLYITTTGEGYINYLSANIDYIQEVMLDTKVEVLKFGSGWNYEKMEERFELLLKFLTLLSEVDRSEMEMFSAFNNIDDYKQYFNEEVLITKHMFIKIKDRITKILTSVIENQRTNEKKEYYRDFKAKHLAIYEDRIITLENFEQEIFK